jgi:molybdopterin converting factor subunit 1
VTVNVLLFASYAESVGTSSLSFELPEGSRVQDALARIHERASGALPPSPLVAVNQSYARLTDVLRAGDELAVIPPVAGG